MKKIIELLNERKGSKLYYAANGSIRMVGGFPISELEIISKKFGFIGWLVENDKIDTRKIDEDRLETIQYSEKERITICDWLLMLLSISNSPIEDLILYLK